MVPEQTCSLPKAVLVNVVAPVIDTSALSRVDSMSPLPLPLPELAIVRVRVAPLPPGVMVMLLPATNSASVCARAAMLKSLIVLAVWLPVWFTRLFRLASVSFAVAFAATLASLAFSALVKFSWLRPLPASLSTLSARPAARASGCTAVSAAAPCSAVAAPTSPAVDGMKGLSCRSS
ncbi:hypothetical protein D3C84_540230 [compost metagenome]